MKLTGSQIVAEILREHDVDTVFGYPGGTALNLYDALYEYRDQIRHIKTSHEQGAAHAADGYARATGKVGVVVATSGPGATNLVTGLATANLDSIPMVAITCNVPDALIGRDAFQEVSIASVTMSVTKHNYFINHIEDLPDALHNAFRIAMSGRKGPVLVDITKDVTAAVMDYKPGVEQYVPGPLPKADMETVEKMARIINNAKRPVIYYGGGVRASRSGAELMELVEKADIPATYTLMAAGTMSYDDPHNMGLIGMHGTVAANRAVDRADVLLALGTRFSDRVALNPEEFAKKAKKLQVDIDRSEINKNVIVDLSCCCDMKDFLQKLLPLIEEKEHKEWVEEVTSMKTTIIADESDGRLHPHQIFHTVCNNTDKETIYVTDVGQHQMWAAQFLENRNTARFLTSGGLGTMGFGYGAAIGAQIGNPDKRVIHITGDGCLHMNMNEAATAVNEGLPIITILFDNHALGMVKQWQTKFYDNRYIATVDPTMQTDYKKMIEAFGGVGFTAEDPKGFEKVFKEALKVENKPVWIWCSIDPEELVLPMIPGGGTVDDMIIG